MPNSGSIRAGRAYVEIGTDNSKLDPGLREAEAKLRSYNQRVRQLNKEAAAAAKAGDQGQAIRLGMTSRQLEQQSARMTERAGTLSQRDDSRAALAQRLAVAKAGKAALLADQTDLENRLAVATLKPREVALRDLDRHFAAMRAKYAGNAKMLAMIEQTAAAERAKVNSDYSQGLLGKLGGKRLIKQEVKYAAANMAGMEGGPLGMATMAALTMSATAAGVAGALILVGGAYQAAVTQAAKLVEKQQAHADAVRESLRWMQSMAAGPTTASGTQFASRAETLEKEADDIEKAAKKEAKELGLLDAGWAALQSTWRGGIANTDLGQATQEDIARFREKQDQIRQLRLWAKEERDLESVRRSEAQDSAVESARIAAMANGPEKERLALLQRQADQRRRVADEHEDRTRLLAKDTSPGADFRQWEEGYNQQRELGKLDQQQAFERAALERQIAEEARRDQVAAAEAQINATQSGFARELALLKAKHLSERDEYTRAGKDKTALLQRQRYDEQALLGRRDEQVREIEDGLRNAVKAAGGVAGSREVDWLGIDKQLRDLGLLEGQIQRIRGLWQTKNAAQDNQAILDQIDELNTKLAVATGKMTEADAAMARLAKEHPAASAENLDKLRAAQEKADAADFAKGELEGLKTPAERFKDYRGKLDKALSAGVLTDSQLQALLQAKMAELTGGAKSLGTFNVAAIGQMAGGSTADRAAKAAEQTARNTGRMLEAMDEGDRFV